MLHVPLLLLACCNNSVADNLCTPATGTHASLRARCPSHPSLLQWLHQDMPAAVLHVQAAVAELRGKQLPPYSELPSVRSGMTAEEMRARQLANSECQPGSG